VDAVRTGLENFWATTVNMTATKKEHV
jgi:hypothetical protein